MVTGTIEGVAGAVMVENDPPPGDLPLPSAREEWSFPSCAADTPQTRSPSYRLAYLDQDFMLRQELRPVRFQLELLKPDMILDEAGIDATIVVFGSARTGYAEDPQGVLEAAEAAAREAPDDPQAQARLKAARRVATHARAYREARRFGQLCAEAGHRDPANRLVIVTGGGPGVMEAANRGAAEGGAPSIGLNIVLPHEQSPNPWVTPELCFQFHYFALRKMHFLMRARALVVFPGGFGTLDELFETLCLIQTGKARRIPVLLFDEAFWKRVISFETLVEEGMIAAEDVSLFRYVETAEDAWAIVEAFHKTAAPRRVGRGRGNGAG